jgi:hypothetical protein
MGVASGPNIEQSGQVLNLDFGSPEINKGAFDIASINPFLWLSVRDSNSSILDYTNTNRAVAILDKSRGVQNKLHYRGDYRTTIGTETANFATITGGNSATDDFGRTEHGCLKAVLTDGSQKHQINFATGLTVEKVYNATALVFIPSSQTIDGVRLQFGNTVRYKDYQTIGGKWTKIEFKGFPILSDAFVIRILGGTSQTPTADNDYFFVKFIEINEIKAIHFIAPGATTIAPIADVPTRPTKFTFDGADDVLSNTLDVSRINQLSTGSISYLADGSTSMLYFSAANSTLSNEYVMVFTYQSKARLIIRTTSDHAQYDSDDTILAGDYVEWYQDGILLKLRINGIEKTYTQSSGTNKTRWFSFVPSMDKMSIGASSDASVVYGAGEFREFIILDYIPTLTQSKKISDQLRFMYEIDKNLDCSVKGQVAQTATITGLGSYEIDPPRFKSNAVDNLSSTHILIAPEILFADSAEWSFETWIKFDTNYTANKSLVRGSRQWTEYIMLVGDAASSCQIRYRTSGTGSVIYTLGAYFDCDLINNWGHIVVTVDSNRNMKAYFNGEFLGGKVPIYTRMGFQRLAEGYALTNPFNLQGQMSIARVYNNELSAGTIKRHFESQKGRFGLK